MDACKSAGCIACYLDFQRSGFRYYYPTDIHHMTKAGRRLGHDKTVCLCKPHHKRSTADVSYNVCNAIGPSWHEQRAEFRLLYGDDEDLVKLQNELIST